MIEVQNPNGLTEGIKIAAAELPLDWGSKAVRIFGADRALLLIEAVAIAKVFLLGIAYPLRRRP